MKKNSFLLLVFLTLATVVNAQLETDFVKSGNEKFKAKDYAGAIVEYNQAITKSPTDKVALYNRGLCLKNTKKFPEAIKDFSLVFQLDSSKNFDAVNNCVSCALEMKDYASANGFLTKAIELKKDNARLYFLRGQSFAQLKNNKMAIADYKTATEIDTTMSDAYFASGMLKRADKDFKGSVADYTQTLKYTPNNQQVWFYRGYSYNDLKQYQKAIDDFSKAIEIKPDYTNAFTMRGTAYFGMKKAKEACDDWKKAVELGDKNAPTYIKQYCK
ncbi:MAG TPA: hypothetical protein DCQ31_09225 [Bacteroidales bacterium]|nr:hypothetical protein [Bacteroidales bacterium]